MKKKFIIILMLISCLTLNSCQIIDMAIPTNDGANMLSGTKWNASDKSQIHFFEDGTFKYYRYPNDFSDNYYEGTYSFYKGEDAINYITNDLPKYGVSASEWNGLISRNPRYTRENSVCLMLNNEACIVGGKNTITTPFSTPYMGFYFEKENVLDLANMNTANYSTFTKVIE